MFGRRESVAGRGRGQPETRMVDGEAAVPVRQPAMISRWRNGMSGCRAAAVSARCLHPRNAVGFRRCRRNGSGTEPAGPATGQGAACPAHSGHHSHRKPTAARSTVRPYRVPVPVWNQNVPSNHRAPAAVPRGVPSDPSRSCQSNVSQYWKACPRHAATRSGMKPGNHRDCALPGHTLRHEIGPLTRAGTATDPSSDVSCGCRA